MKKMKKATALSGKSKGFTLIELVVVMAIIAVLALMVVAAITAARRQSIESQNRNNARTVEVAMEARASQNNGQYPTIGTAAAPQAINVALTNTAAGFLGNFAPGWAIGTCPNGGGDVVSTATGYTIRIFNHTCALVSGVPMHTITR
jgi:prepilin-type N-terminal cleavage/methylation domain-containing protein